MDVVTEFQLVEQLHEMLGRFMHIRMNAPVCDGHCEDDPEEGEPCIWRLAQQGTEIARTTLAAIKPVR